jgi:hypothetical protein
MPPGHSSETFNLRMDGVDGRRVSVSTHILNVVEAEHVRVPVRLKINIMEPNPLVLQTDFSIIFPELLKIMEWRCF